MCVCVNVYINIYVCVCANKYITREFYAALLLMTVSFEISSYYIKEAIMYITYGTVKFSCSHQSLGVQSILVGDLTDKGHYQFGNRISGALLTYDRWMVSKKN